MHDATCSHPAHDFKEIDYDSPACKHFEPEEI